MPRLRNGGQIERRRRLAFGAAVALCVAALALAACGGMSSLTSHGSSTTAAGSSPNRQAAASSPSGSSSGAPAGASTGKSGAAGGAPRSSGAVQSHDAILQGKVIQRAAPGTGSGTKNDDNGYRADPASSNASAQINPCALVPRSAAESIIGQPVARPRVAPLGPTCIYQVPKTRQTITLTVELADFSKIRPHLHGVKRVHVGGQTAYCGNLGGSMTFLPLPNRTVLNVSAPCSVGEKLAAAALTRLRA
jgi:hypothetical protein